MRRFLLLSCFTLLSQFSYAENIRNVIAQSVRKEHTLIVPGASSVFRPADKLSLTVGVVTFNQDVGAAVSANADRMKAVVSTLKDLGLNDKELQTGDFTIQPKYAPTPHNPPADWQPTIVGYEVRNTLTIHTNKLDLANQIIAAAGKESANLIQDLTFTLQNEQSAKSEAIAQAVRQAEGYAEAAAKEAKVRLGEIQEINIHSSYISPRMLKADRMVEAQGIATPILPGEVEVHANVTIIYLIYPTAPH